MGCMTTEEAAAFGDQLIDLATAALALDQDAKAERLFRVAAIYYQDAGDMRTSDLCWGLTAEGVRPW